MTAKLAGPPPAAAGNVALGGVRVAELSRSAAAARAGMTLADFGASVTRVIATDGDPGTRLQGGTAPLWDRGKGVADLGQDGPGAAASLLQSADVVIEDWGDELARSHGIDFSRLTAACPHLIVASIGSLGLPASFPSVPPYDPVILAYSGRMLEMGQLFGMPRPAHVPVPVATFAASQAALQGILAALHERGRSGRGQRVRTSMLRALSAFDIGSWMISQVSGQPAGAAAQSRQLAVPWMGYLTAQASDGTWLQFANWAEHLFWAQADALGLGWVRQDPAFAGLPHEATPRAQRAFWKLVLDRVAERPADHWVALSRQTGAFGVEPFCYGGEAASHPQIQHNGDTIRLSDPLAGSTSQPGPLAHLRSTPARVRPRPTPTASHAGRPPAAPRPAAPRPAAAAPRPTPPAMAPAGHSGDDPPLADVTVLEFATMFAGPFGPALLADLGARVIKVEPLSGDSMRANPLLAVKTQQGKESIAVDLKHPESGEIIRRLAGRADIVVENFRPGVATRLGVDYAALSSVNPSIIYVHATGYGTGGPSARLPAYHPTPGALCGAAARQAGRGLRLRGGAALAGGERVAASLRLAQANEGHPDPASALVVATAALLGLVARDQTGLGQEIETSMLAANALLMGDEWIRYDGIPRPQTRPDPELYGLSALQRLYPTAQGWIYLHCATDQEWSRLLGALGGQALCRPEFATAQAREDNDGPLAAALTATFRGRDADEWERLLSGLGVACVRADRATYPGLLASHPAFREDEFIVDADHPEFGRHWRHGPVVRYSRSATTCGPGTRVGEHTRSVLVGLGFSEAEIDHLRRSRVVTWPAGAAEPDPATGPGQAAGAPEAQP